MRSTDQSPAEYATALHFQRRTIAQRAVDALREFTRTWHQGERWMLALAIFFALAVLPFLSGCGGGDCPEDDPRCVEPAQPDTPAPKPPCTDPRRCI